MKRVVIFSLVLFFALAISAQADVRVNTDTSGRQFYPSIAINDSGKVLVTWNDQQQQDTIYNIKGQFFNSNGSPHNSNFQVNWLDIAAMSDIASSSSSLFGAVWHGSPNENPNDHLDVYYKLLNSTGDSLAAYSPVNDDAGETHQVYPKISMDNSGNAKIIWVDQRDTARLKYDYDGFIYGQLIDYLGNPQGSNFLIDSLAHIDASYGPERFDIATDSVGNFVVTWVKLLSDDLYARLFNANSQPKGEALNVFGPSLSSAFAVSTAINKKGYFVIAYLGRSFWSFPDSFFIQLFSPDGQKLGTNTPVAASYGVGVIFLSLDVAIEGNRIVVVWANEINNNIDVYAQKLKIENDSLVLVGDTLRITSEPWPQGAARVAVNDKYMVYTWKDSSDVYATRTDWCYPIKRGDCNCFDQDNLNLADVIYLANYLLKSGPSLCPFPEAGDVNCDDEINLSDVIMLANYLLKGGIAPCSISDFTAPSP